MVTPAHRISATDVAFKTSDGRAEVVRRAHRLTPLERALLIQQISDAIYASAASGKAVELA